MGAFFIATENDIRTWIREAVKNSLEEILAKQPADNEVPEEFLSRKEIAQKLGISLVTLTDWVKRELPSHKYRGRVYFLFSEVMDYIKNNQLKKFT